MLEKKKPSISRTIIILIFLNTNYCSFPRKKYLTRLTHILLSYSIAKSKVSIYPLFLTHLFFFSLSISYPTYFKVALTNLSLK